MTICYSLASRSRPDKFFETLDNIQTMSKEHNHFIVAKLDDDDHSMNNDFVRSKIVSYPSVMVKWGKSISKIHAINRDLDDIPKWDIMICVSDDMRFRTYGYDDIIRQHMPEDLDGFLHIKDDYAKEKVCTVSIIGRKYYERDGYIYNPAYYSLWCDNEAHEIAVLRGCYKEIPGSIEHLHYTAGKASKDQLYKRNDTYHEDQRIFNERKANNFYL